MEGCKVMEERINWNQHHLNWDRLMASGVIKVTKVEMKVLVKRLEIEDYVYHSEQLEQDCWTIEVP